MPFNRTSQDPVTDRKPIQGLLVSFTKVQDFVQVRFLGFIKFLRSRLPRSEYDHATTLEVHLVVHFV